ncbi:unnamed protein product [Sphagnum troendelagicum]|uniref:DUF676 domain-containing protein n=1 Tax=Sphagnum troendelagicum TaxID=128251 RepID=A0ABP0ULQ5_9BRYO
MLDYSQAYWKTWIGGKKDEDGKEFCWPMTWLKEDLPRARIWSLSYDSTAWRTSTTGNVDGFASGETLVQEMVENAHIGQDKRSVVFACHSLGGLIVKEIVIIAHNTFQMNERYVNFLRNIRGYLFYSTPHDGSHLADYVRHMPKMGKMVSKLEVINEGIGRLNANFERIERENYPNQWQFSAIGEANPTKVPFTTTSMKVVEEASARHGYNFITVQTDHFGVCKPEDKTSNSYTRLLNLVKDVVHDNPSPQTDDEIKHERSELIYSKVMQKKT